MSYRILTHALAQDMGLAYAARHNVKVAVEEHNRKGVRGFALRTGSGVLLWLNGEDRASLMRGHAWVK